MAVVGAPVGGRDAKMAAGAFISFPRCKGPGIWWTWRQSCSGRSRGWSWEEGGGFGMAAAAGGCLTAGEACCNGGEVLESGRCGGCVVAGVRQRPQQQGVEREGAESRRRWRQ